MGTLAVCVAAALAVAVASGVGVQVGMAVLVLVGADVDVAVGVCVGVLVDVGSGLGVGENVAVGALVGAEPAVVPGVGVHTGIVCARLVDGCQLAAITAAAIALAIKRCPRFDILISPQAASVPLMYCQVRSRCGLVNNWSVGATSTRWPSHMNAV